MTKKEYQKPTVNVVMIQHSQMLCHSLDMIQSTGLDEGETMDYGDNQGKKTNSIWDAW
ncbi:MAG: hypothetical protein K5928_02525 [Prevotella sp.]|nr:hypothetical protein [Prevotella sp.]